MADLDVCGGAYSMDAPVAVQECLNMFPEVEKRGSQSRIVLRRFPGLKSFVTPATGAPIRGLKTMGDFLYVVAGSSLFKVSDTAQATNLGTIAGTGLVSMDHDGTNLVIVNGTSTGYVYDSSSLATIADADFKSSDKVLYLDTYFVHQRTDTNQFFISESGSATSYIATDIASKEGAPNDLRSIVSSNRDLLLGGEQTIEFWRNTGNPDFPFQRQEGTFQQHGVKALRSMIEVDNDVYFLGEDDVVYALSGYQPRRVSHHAIEKWISEQSLSDREAANAMTVTFQGHYWYILSFNKGTWVYDATTSADMQESQWFQLESKGETNWRVDVVAEAFGKVYCGGNDGVIYELDPDTFTENGETQTKRRTTPYYHSERRPIVPSRIKLAVNQGVGNSDVTEPQVSLEISRDWGRTWSNKRYRSLGTVGEYSKNTTWDRNGATKNGHVLRFTCTDDCDFGIQGGWAEFGVGNG